MDTIQTLNGFLVHQEGQDLVEYALLLAFVCLASAALFMGESGSLVGIWTAANKAVTNANAAVTGS